MASLVLGGGEVEGLLFNINVLILLLLGLNGDSVLYLLMCRASRGCQLGTMLGHACVVSI